MPRYIDADEAIRISKEDKFMWVYDLTDLDEFLVGVPTADVVPKTEVDKIYDLPDEDYQALMNTVKKLSQHMEKQLGQRTLWKVVGTDVPHAHVHLEPFDETWFHGREVEMTEDDFKQIQQQLQLSA